MNSVIIWYLKIPHTGLGLDADFQNEIVDMSKFPFLKITAFTSSKIKMHAS